MKKLGFLFALIAILAFTGSAFAAVTFAYNPTTAEVEEDVVVMEVGDTVSVTATGDAAPYTWTGVPAAITVTYADTTNRPTAALLAVSPVGATEITVEDFGNPSEGTFSVQVYAKVDSVIISGDGDATTLVSGDTLEITATTDPVETLPGDWEWEIVPAGTTAVGVTIDETEIGTTNMIDASGVTVLGTVRVKATAPGTSVANDPAKAFVEVEFEVVYDDPTGVTVALFDSTFPSSIDVDDDTQLIATVEPQATTSQGVDWSVVSVDPATASAEVVGGLVTGVEPGIVRVIASSDIDPDTAGSFNIQVYAEVGSVSFDQKNTDVKVEVDKSYQLKAAVLPRYARPGLVWSSDKQASADVDVTTGLVTGKAVGTATITVSSDASPDVAAQCTVTVFAYEKKLYVSGDVSFTRVEGETEEKITTVEWKQADNFGTEFAFVPTEVAVSSADTGIAYNETTKIISMDVPMFEGTYVIWLKASDDTTVSSDWTKFTVDVAGPGPGDALVGNFVPATMTVSEDYSKTATMEWKFGVTPVSVTIKSTDVTFNSTYVDIDAEAVAVSGVSFDVFGVSRTGATIVKVIGEYEKDGTTYSDDAILTVTVVGPVVPPPPPGPEPIEGEIADLGDINDDFEGLVTTYNGMVILTMDAVSDSLHAAGYKKPLASYDIIYMPAMKKTAAAGAVAQFGLEKLSADVAKGAYKTEGHGLSSKHKFVKIDPTNKGKVKKFTKHDDPKGDAQFHIDKDGDKFYFSVKQGGAFDYASDAAAADGYVVDPGFLMKGGDDDSGGGCSAAYAPFALLLAAPLFFLRKKD